MQKVSFMPAVGSSYMTTGVDGLRIMIIGESHYGPSSHYRPEITQEVVRWLGQARRHAFFTRVSQIVLALRARQWVPDDVRSGAFEKVVFYNFVQELMSDTRVRPSDAQFLAAMEVLPGVVSALQPDLIIALGLRMSPFIPDGFGEIEVVKGVHPSAQADFRLDVWVDKVNAAKERARKRHSGSYRAIAETADCLDWAASFARATAEGLPDKLKQLELDQLGPESDGTPEAPKA